MRIRTPSLFLYMHVRACELRLLQGLRSAVVDNIRRRIVGVMFPPSIFEDRCVDFRRSMCRPSMDRKYQHES